MKYMFQTRLLLPKKDSKDCPNILKLKTTGGPFNYAAVHVGIVALL